MAAIDSEGVDSDLLFSTPLRSLLRSSLGLLRWRHRPRIHYGVLLGRPITSDTQTLDDIIDTNGRILVNTGTQNVAQNQAIGVLLSTGDVAGNAAIAVVANEDGFTYELTALIYSYVADATVATRTTGALRMNGIGPTSWYATGTTNKRVCSTGTMTLTASQDGTITLASNEEVEDQEGTVAVTASRSLPRYVLGLPALDAAIATNGQAGDVQRAVIIGRRVA